LTRFWYAADCAPLDLARRADGDLANSIPARAPMLGGRAFLSPAPRHARLLLFRSQDECSLERNPLAAIELQNPTGAVVQKIIDRA